MYRQNQPSAHMIMTQQVMKVENKNSDHEVHESLKDTREENKRVKFRGTPIRMAPNFPNPDA